MIENVTIGFADDQEVIHDVIDEYCRDVDDMQIEVIHFYDTSDVEDYVFEHPWELDMLFLDIVFDGSVSGTEALPDIKDLVPDLPIVFLTGNDKDNPDVDNIIKNNLAAGYLEKPVSQKLFLNMVRSIKNVKNEISKMKKEIQDNETILEEFEKEYQDKLNEAVIKIGKSLDDSSKELKKIENLCAEVVAKKIPDTIKIMFGRTYSNLEFRDKVLVELCGKNFDERIFKLLSALNNNQVLPSGTREQLFPEFGVQDLYEYMISQKSRLFVQKRKGNKLLVYDVDYNHDKH